MPKMSDAELIAFELRQISSAIYPEYAPKTGRVQSLTEAVTDNTRALDDMACALNRLVDIWNMELSRATTAELVRQAKAMLEGTDRAPAPTHESTP